MFFFWGGGGKWRVLRKQIYLEIGLKHVRCDKMVPSHENQSNLFAAWIFSWSRGTPDMSILCWRSWRSSWMMDLWPESTPFYCCVHGTGAHPCFVFVFFRMLNHWIKEVAMKNQCGLQWLQLGDICKRVKYMYIYIYMGISWFVPKLCIIIDYRIQFGVMPSN